MEAMTIEEVNWLQAERELRKIRTEVFLHEQHVPAELEWDGLDEVASHLLLRNDLDEAIGCARILNHSKIGRMAILKAWRNRGYGAALLKAAIAHCRNHDVQVMQLSAQVNAIGFYAKFGFEVCSEVYDDANIPHQDMRLIC